MVPRLFAAAPGAQELFKGSLPNVWIGGPEFFPRHFQRRERCFNR